MSRTDKLKASPKRGLRKLARRLAGDVARKSNLEAFLHRFRDNYASIELIRVGGEGDGGYLVPDVFENVSTCFSPGVSVTADFEMELSDRHGIVSFMADASVDAAPTEDENFRFSKHFLGSRTQGHFITLSDWMQASLTGSEEQIILQMDIEGGEYDVLIVESAETLARFSVMVIEFHGLERLFHKGFLQMFSAMFEKLYQDFAICHVHPNNCCGVDEMRGIEVPRVAEITFIRRDLLSRFPESTPVSLPHPLDRKNVPENPDLVMPDVWWKA